MNGFELAQEIRKFDPRGFIIFYYNTCGVKLYDFHV